MSDSRLFKILYHLLDKGRATAPELAAKFEVSQRTIYRDIDALSSAGIPVYTEPGRNGGICLLDDFILDRAVLTEKEKQEILTSLQGILATGYAAGEEMLTKLAALFHVDTENWLEVDFSRWGDFAFDNTKFETLKTAVIQHREIKFIYAGTNGTSSQRTVCPLKLLYKSKGWYLKAFCLTKQDFRIFKLNRISDLELLTQTFVPKPYPEPEETSPPACQRIVLSFTREIAYRVYDEFDTAQITCQDNGSLTASAEMPVDAWLIGYLLSFGTQVEILEPQYLKEIVAEQALQIYKKSINPEEMGKS